MDQPSTKGRAGWADRTAPRRGVETRAQPRRYDRAGLRRYVGSARPYPSTLRPPNIRLHFLVKKVTDAGTFRFQRRVLYLANAPVDHRTRGDR
jgi:hypothetical protein